MGVGAGVAARISEFSYTKNLESEVFFIKNPNLTKKKILALDLQPTLKNVSNGTSP